MPKSAKTMVFAVALEESWGITRMVARILYVGESGTLQNPDPASSYKGAEFAGFEVSAYLDRDNVRAWGFTADFRDVHWVDLRRAQTMVRVLRKLGKGLEKLETEQGYVVNDFGTYLFRVASVFGIQTFYIRNTEVVYRRTSTRYSPRNAVGVRQWIADCEMEFSKPSPMSE